MLGFKETQVYILIENTCLAHFNFQCFHLNMVGLKQIYLSHNTHFTQFWDFIELLITVRLENVIWASNFSFVLLPFQNHLRAATSRSWKDTIP